MATSTAIKSLLELTVVLFLIYGFYKEDRVIAFEQRLLKKIKRLIYRTIVFYENHKTNILRKKLQSQKNK